ncbi:hypothetical protein GCM10010319_60780 [Streptomyces blastmyceticus]|uniref:SnoaL-like domain-containing protein n=1 Tax=Streptomyces blastmyceticus TaxID=68180 RepID=A0ABP3HNJ1_9ACTN
MNTSTARTRATVQEFLRLTATGDPARIAAVFADRIDWQIAENPAVSWIRPRSTRADAAAHFRELAEGLVLEAAENTVDSVVVEGADAMLTGHLA